MRVKVIQGPYPIPRDAPIEGGPNSEGDRHVIVIDRDKWKLYELFSVKPNPIGTIWTAGAGAIFDLKSNALRPDGWTSADAAGCRFFRVSFVTTKFSSSVRFATLCVLPCSVRGVLMSSRAASCRAWRRIGFAADGNAVRLKASFDISSYSPSNQVILRALETLWHVRRRQWTQLVSERRARPALERR
jgi:hypothetical protein